jgi:hypothetical protein
MRPARCSDAAICGGLLLAGCTGDPAQPYTTTYTPPAPYVISGVPDRNAPLPSSVIATPPSTYVPIWRALGDNRPSFGRDITHDVATAGMTVGGLEAMQRLKAAQAARAAAKLPAPELPAPAVEGAAGATAERKLAGKLLTREGTVVAEHAAEKKATGMLLRGAVVAEEGEGLWVLLRLLPFL